MAFALARALGEPGALVDLFAGAGGLSLGFHWAGWSSVVANDIDKYAMQTFARNIHPNTVVGDIRDPKIKTAILDPLGAVRRRKKPLVLVGGPPCQGFSTAGNRRSLCKAPTYFQSSFLSHQHRRPEEGPRTH